MRKTQGSSFVLYIKRKGCILYCIGCNTPLLLVVKRGLVPLFFIFKDIVINMFSKNDFVVILGATQKDKCFSNFTFALAIVLGVGKYDLLVQPLTGVYKTDYVISKESCQRINFEILKTHVSKRKPKINDLVVYVKRKYKSYKEDDKIFLGNGILVEIMDKPGDTLTCKILTDSETVTASIKDVIVLEDENA
jgi:hypothetical protein